MNDGYKAIPVPPKVEYRVTIYAISIGKCPANIIKTSPPTRACNGGPRSYFFFGIPVASSSFVQGLQGYDAHWGNITSQFVKCQRK
jgi:hypothetical protein